MIKEIVCVLFFLIFIIRNENINCTVMTESSSTAAQYVDGKMLQNLGRQLNKPVLKLLGMAIINLEEEMHPCDEWTEWTDCDRVWKGYIAIRKRTRTCRTRHTIDHKNSTTETDINICEGFCPRDYNLTANGFCVKLYTGGKTFDDAEKQCQQDGGNVINIDSALKNTDVKNILQGTSYAIFIDGRRKDSSSPWLTVDGLEKKYFYWRSGQPDNDLCIYWHYANSFWYDSVCNSYRPFMCEIMQ